MIIKALGNTVLTEPRPKEKKVGSIVLPETTSERDLVIGKIVSKGEGKRLPNGQLKLMDDLIQEGVDVIYESSSIGGEPKVDGGYYQSVNADLLLGVIEED